ncbi:protein of unknown function [Pseudovibrio denitrificans]|uniref:IrrE N-terminal-like domain-containing protein n=1 Tax=Pseudovibrio denitrificans TaxID=258256 RepID=A0A1I7DV45_9HYPH|nr:ImmA/IrrE family metallo-endopeptidase [Pseudovibrio denitrificans]SFU15550.1 protein of unknown function [Pseudovibrio denitrificans]
MTVSVASKQRAFSRELREAGFEWSKVKKTLPDWYKEAFTTNSGVLELRSFVAKHLGLKFGNDGKLTLRDLPAVCFKTAKGTDPADVLSARAFATTTARVVARATDSEWRGMPSDPSEIRKCVLAEHSEFNWIDFQSLVKYCWSIGVPVLYLPESPSSGKKMEGMVSYCAGRPVIILTKKNNSSDWHLFTLAHELGHIALGHLPMTEGEAVVDEAIIRDERDDEQELEANKFATNLLAEGKKLRLQRLLNAGSFANVAVKYAKENSVSPGHVILSASNHTQKKGQKVFALGNSALSQLPEKYNRKTGVVCKSVAHDYMDLYELSSDSFEYLENLNIL